MSLQGFPAGNIASIVGNMGWGDGNLQWNFMSQYFIHSIPHITRANTSKYQISESFRFICLYPFQNVICIQSRSFTCFCLYLFILLSAFVLCDVCAVDFFCFTRHCFHAWWVSYVHCTVGFWGPFFKSTKRGQKETLINKFY